MSHMHPALVLLVTAFLGAICRGRLRQIILLAVDGVAFAFGGKPGFDLRLDEDAAANQSDDGKGCGKRIERA